MSEHRLKPYAWGDLLNLPKRKPLIKGVLDCNALSVVYGASNSGKTFFMLDMAIHIAMGAKWCGKRIKQGSVVYIAAEGGLGISERLEAFQKFYNLSGNDLPPFYTIPTGIDLCSEDADTNELILEINEFYKKDKAVSDSDVIRCKCGRCYELSMACPNCGYTDSLKPKLIIIDTLSRAMSGGNENSSDDMGAFIKNCDLIKECTEAHVSIVHHSGKDSSKGARGHSLLRAAVDTEIEIKNSDGLITAEVKKQRDGKTGGKYSFEIKPLKIGTDEDGDDIISCALEPTENKLEQKHRLTGQKKRAYDLLLNLIIEKGKQHIPKKGMSPQTVVLLSDFKADLKKGNIVNSDKQDSIGRSINRIITELNNRGFIATWEDYVWIPGQGGRIQDKLPRQTNKYRTDKTAP